jgi:hypothetical protein
MNEAGFISECSRWQTRALATGAIAAGLSIIGTVFQRAQFFHSYLFAWLFWAGLPFGALVVVMMQFLTGGQWGLAIRGLSTAAFRTLPFIAVLFLPVLLGMHDIYGWSNGARAEVPGYHHKAQYLNVPFFTARSVFYFVVLSIIGMLLRRWMVTSAHTKKVPRRIAALSAVGLIVYVLCMNFASTDWVMSLTPEWYSTVFVEVFAGGQFLSALALMTALLCLFSDQFSLGEIIPAKVFQDLGSMLVAFVIFWAYVSFSQFLIIWSGNLPKEISWYLDRSSGGWQWLALALALGQLFLPFALLLSRERKRHPRRLARVCILIVLANVADNFWLVAPAFHPRGIYVHWLDLTAWLALGGFWFALFFYFLKQQPLLPPQLQEGLQHG